MTEKKGGIPIETQVLMGEQLKQLPEKRKLKFGGQVSEALAEHKKTMLQYSPEEVRQITDEGRAVIAIDRPSDSVSAFAQLSPWYNQGGEIKAIEFRSWISSKAGAGLQVMRDAVILSLEKYPNIPIYAVVEEENVRAQQIFLLAGAIEVSMPDSMKVVLKAGEQPAPVKTYDLANVKPINRAA